MEPERVSDEEGAARGTNETQITTKDGVPFEVPKEGSLSLLALGYRGLIAWRAKRKEAAKARPANTADNTPTAS